MLSQMIWVQGRITMAPRPRGFHLITQDILDGVEGLGQIRVGLLHLLIHPAYEPGWIYCPER